MVVSVRLLTGRLLVQVQSRELIITPEKIVNDDRGFFSELCVRSQGEALGFHPSKADSISVGRSMAQDTKVYDINDYVYVWDGIGTANKYKILRFLNKDKTVCTGEMRPGGHQAIIIIKNIVMFAHEKGPSHMKWDGENWTFSLE